MPTLVKETQQSGDGSGGWSECETAGTSGMRWVAENLTCRASLDLRDASTWSDSLILESTVETTTGQLKRHHQQQHASLTPSGRSSPPNFSKGANGRGDSLTSHGEANLTSHSSQSFNEDSLSKTMNEEDIAIHLSNPQQQRHEQDQEHSSERTEPSSPSPTPSTFPPRRNWHLRHDDKLYSRPDRKMGPNEKLYTEEYGPMVADYIRAFQLRYPGQLRNYRSMNDDAKRREQEHVVQLLQRLRANKENAVLTADTGGDDDAVARLKANHQRVEVHENSTLSNDSACETSLVLLSPAPFEPTNTQSQILFSPVANEQDASDTSMALSPVKPNAMTNGDAYTKQSVGGHSNNKTAGSGYESPETVRRETKRLASTSGKRGADSVRARLLDDADEFSIDDYKHSTSPSKELVNSIGRLSLVDESIFTSSQSPIVPRMTHSPIQNEYSPNDYVAPDISFGVNHDESDLSCQLESDSLIETAMLPEKRVRWDFEGRLTKEAPTDVRLLDGRVPQWPKLPMERLKSAALPTQSFPDPLCLYPEKMQRRLTRLYSWLRQLDRSRPNEVGCAVLLSLSTLTIVDLVLKLQLDTVTATGSKDQGFEKNGILTGNTLIVARSKDDLEIWGRSFREGSVCSVFNHASLATTQRKSLSTSEYAVQFDVVLTTFDALKSPDVTLTLDPRGFATNKNTGLRQGWYTSASQTTESVVKKQFSALHRVNWNRIVFLDVLGRKSYLAKSDTARVQASRAINSSTRLVFFVSDENEATGVDMLMKTDRSVCQSLCSVLRLEESGSDEEVLRSRIVDFQDKSTHLAMKVKK